MAEKRLIDADEKQIIIQALKMHHDSQFTPGVYEHSVFGKAALLLESTVDAVEVVRCHECKKWDQETWFCEEHSTFGHNGLEWDMFNPNDFCSYGEKRGV